MFVSDRLSIGERVKLVREANGLTQGGLAELLGISREVLANIETGRREIKATTLEQVAAALDIEPVAFFDKRWEEVAEARRRVVEQAQAIFDEAKRGQTATHPSIIQTPLSEQLVSDSDQSGDVNKGPHADNRPLRPVYFGESIPTGFAPNQALSLV